jgi:hypothetical protein
MQSANIEMVATDRFTGASWRSAEMQRRCHARTRGNHVRLDENAPFCEQWLSDRAMRDA